MERNNKHVLNTAFRLSLKLLFGFLLLSATLVACNFPGEDAAQSKHAIELVKKKNFQEAEHILQALVLKNENKLREIKAESKAQGKTRVEKTEKEQARRLSTAYKNLGTVLFESGKYGEAEQYLEKTIETYREYFGKENSFVAEAMNLLALSYYKQGKLMEAERYYEDLLAIQRNILSPGNLSLAYTANNLASIYQKQGDDEQAEKYFQWALNLCLYSKLSEKDMDRLADIMNNLALFYQKRGDYASAKAMIQKALAIENRHNSIAFSVDKVRSLLVLASIEKSCFDLEASESHYQQAMELVNKSLPTRTDLASEAQFNYAELLASERKFKDAEPVYEKALNSCEKAYGSEHPKVAEMLSDFSQLYKRTAKYNEAEALLKRALSIQEVTIGVDTQAYLATVYRLASILATQNKYSDADEIYKEVLPKLKNRIGPDHPFVADTYDNWSGFVDRTGDRERAESLRASAGLIRRKIARSIGPVYGPEL